MTRPKKNGDSFRIGLIFSIIFTTNINKGLEKYRFQKSRLGYDYVAQREMNEKRDVRVRVRERVRVRVRVRARVRVRVSRVRVRLRVRVRC